MKLIYTLLFLSLTQLTSAQTRHTISIQSGLIHSFFDNTPLMNINYTSKDQGLFHGVFLGSTGLSYAYALNQKSSIAFEAYRLSQLYVKFKDHHILGDMQSRMFRTYSLNYNRNLALNQKMSFIIGAGISYRNGSVAQYTVKDPLPYTHNYKESNFGVNTITGLRYNFCKNFSLYSILDLRSICYYVNHKELEEYPQFHPNYPNRFDLSLKVGLSFHF